MGKIEVVKQLVSHNPEVLNTPFGVHNRSLLHAVADTEHRSIIDYLLSKDRVPSADHTMRNLRGKTPLECAFRRYFGTAEYIYNLMSLDDRRQLNPYRLLDKIISQIREGHDRKAAMANRIIDDLPLHPINMSCSPYNTALTSHVSPRDPATKNMAKSMWSLLIDRFVPITYYDFHGSTPIANAVQKAPWDLLKELSDSADQRFQEKQEVLNWLTVDMDGDTPREIARRRNESILEIVESGIQWQTKADSINFFVSAQDYQAVVGVYFATENFEGCLDYLDRLPPSKWRQCTEARCYQNLNRDEDARRSLANVERCPVVLRLEGSVFEGLGNHLRALELYRAAYLKEQRTDEKSGNRTVDASNHRR